MSRIPALTTALRSQFREETEKRTHHLGDEKTRKAGDETRFTMSE